MFNIKVFFPLCFCFPVVHVFKNKQKSIKKEKILPTYPICFFNVMPIKHLPGPGYQETFTIIAHFCKIYLELLLLEEKCPLFSKKMCNTGAICIRHCSWLAIPCFEPCIFPFQSASNRFY